MKKILLVLFVVCRVQDIVCMEPGRQAEKEFLEALERDDVETAQELVSQIGENALKNAFWDALKAKNLKKVKTLLDISNISIDMVDAKQNTPLFVAVEYLLQEVKNENIQDIKNVKNIVDIINVILARGPNPSRKNDDWEAPANLAPEVVKAAQKIIRATVKEEIIKLLETAQITTSFKAAQGQYNLFMAIALRNLDFVKAAMSPELLKFNIQGPRNPLLFAVQIGNLDIVKYFLDKGADLSLKNFYGRTALDAARDEFEKATGDKKAKYKEIMDLLEAKEKEIGKTPKTVPSVDQSLISAVQKLTQTLQALQVKIVGG